MDRDKLFTASLRDDDAKLETYDIRKLFYVAFFGGIIPLVGLATKSAKQFKVDRKLIMLLAAAGVIILIGKFAIAFTILDKQPIMDTRTLSWLYKGACCLLYLVYYQLMKEKFTIHVAYGGEIKPILKSAISWILIGIVGEAGIAIFVSWLTSII